MSDHALLIEQIAKFCSDKPHIVRVLCDALAQAADTPDECDDLKRDILHQFERLEAYAEFKSSIEHDLAELGQRIDATPDGGYALRILRHYRDECDVVYSSSSTGIDCPTPLINAMNGLQQMRAKELDAAIDGIRRA